MGAPGWLTIHWLEVLQSIGIISGFIFTAVSLRRESRARKISNMIALAERHHAIWKELYHRPELARILDEQLASDSVSPTREERLFVTSLILHLDGIHRTLKAGMLVQLEGLERDVRGFFSRPVPKAVWQQLRPLQNRDFARFVDSCLEQTPK